MGWALVFPLATSFCAISFKGYCTRVLGLMTYKALPGRQVSITSSRLNAHLSLPTSKRLTVITCGAASAAAELVSNRNARILFFHHFRNPSKRFESRKQADDHQHYRTYRPFEFSHPHKPWCRTIFILPHARYKNITISQRNDHHNHHQDGFEQ